MKYKIKFIKKAEFIVNAEDEKKATEMAVDIMAAGGEMLINEVIVEAVE